jgi:MarR family transcriptional regulator, organic hydroperoxide resistance regulator
MAIIAAHDYADSLPNATIANVNYCVSVMPRFVPSKPRSQSRALVEELGMLIAKARRMVWTNATRRLEESGDSLLAWQVLAVLIRAGKLTQTEVAVALLQHPAGVSRLLDDLEKQGSVERRRDSADRRRVYVHATARGERRFRSILPEVIRGVDQALDPLSEVERRTLRDLLRKIVLQDVELGPALSHGGAGR